MTDSFLAEVTLRAWGTDDPRVLDPLRHENQPSHTLRAEAVGERARNAGWPRHDAFRLRKTITVAAVRLEGIDYQWNGSNHNGLFPGSVAYESRRWEGIVTTTRGGILPVEEDDTGTYNHDDGPATIFDE